jgi:Nucleotide modification associated domain 3
MASPILPCGCLCSTPIPYKQGVPYSKIRFGNRNLDQICAELKPGWQDSFAHLDPDLRFDSLATDQRPKGWRPAFGQSAASAGHLIKQGIKMGDLFIFFGWFRRTEIANGKLEFDSEDGNGRHIVYGWLEIGEVFPVDGRRQPDHLLFLASHPHVFFSEGETVAQKIGGERDRDAPHQHRPFARS